MKLYKMAFQNVRKSMKDYAVYFFTLILGVAVFYVFNTLGEQTVMLPLQASTVSTLKMMTKIMRALSVFVAVVLGCLILYANQFLMKRRKKEFGLYMMLGMGKGKISRILLYETVGIGLISLVVGLAAGVIFSQLTSMLVANMFEADMSRFNFVFSGTAMLTTVLFFAVMYIPVMLFNAFMIGRCRLIDLFQAGKKNEEVKYKNGTLCVGIFIAAAVILGQAYWQVTKGAATLEAFTDVIFVMFRGALGTYLVFWSLSGLLIRLVMAKKSLYFHQLNSFTLRQVHSRIHTMVASMTVICLMLFVTICVLSTGIYMNREANADLDEKIPADIQVTKKRNLDGKTDSSGIPYKQAQIEESHTTMEDSMREMGVSMGDFTDTFEMNRYSYPELTLGDTLGERALAYWKGIMPDFNFGDPSTLVKISDYNRYARLTGQETFDLKPDEYMILANYETYMNIRNKGLADHTPITLSGKTYVPRYEECKEGYLWMNTSRINGGIFLVPDEAADETKVDESILTANYAASTKKQKRVFETELNDRIKKSPAYGNMVLKISTRLQMSEASIGVGAMATFAALYLGVVFLISSAAILALKELSESADNKERYQVLRKLGTEEKMIRRSLFWQIGIFFALPLLLAVIHSIFGIQVAEYMFDLSGGKWVMSSVTATAGIIVLIYGGYFLITYFCSRNMIREN